MAGRGGRGAQLLKALELPSRKPKNVGQFPQQPGQQPQQPGNQQNQGQYGQQYPQQNQQYPQHAQQYPPQSQQDQQYPQQSEQYPQQSQQYPQQSQQYPQQSQQYPQQTQQYPQQFQQYPQQTQQYPQQTQQYPQQSKQYPQQTQQYPQQSQQYPQQSQQYPQQHAQHRDESQGRGQYSLQRQCQGQQPIRQTLGGMQPQHQAAGGRGAMLSQAMQQGGQQRFQPAMGRGQLPQQPSPQQPSPQQQYGQQPGRGATSFTQVQQAGIRQTQPFARGGGMPQSVSPSGPPTTRPLPVPSPSGIRAPNTQPPPQQQTVQPPTQALQEMSIKQTDSSTQPGMKGSAGKPVQLAVNYIPLKCKVEGVYQYCVSYKPDIDSIKMRYELLYTHSEFLGNTRGFDGIQLFLPWQLPQQPTVLKSVRCTDGAEIEISIQFVKFVELDKCVQLYNIIFKRVMRALQMQQVGRYYYDPTRPAQIPQHKLELWPGYITSIQHYEGGLMLLADISHKLLRTDCVLEILTELFQQNKSNFQEAATKMLVGSIVLTRYNNKTYRIDDIEWNKNPLNTFTFHTGEEMTYVDYYKQSYNRVIKDHYQPLLVHRPRKKEQPKNGRRQLECVNLIPELCSMTGLTDTMRQDFRVMKDIAVHTRVTPMQREECSKKFLKNVQSNPKAKQILEDWGLQLDSELLRAQGRLLAPEKIKFGSSTINGSPQADWGRDAVKENVITPVGLSSWMIVFSKRDQSKALDFVQTMKKVTPAMGISVNDPLVIEIRDDRTETYLRSIREHLNPNIQVVVIVFPTSRDDRYSAVKKLCCIECPVPSQVINARTISQQNKLRSVTQKIALQINCKLGGELWALDVPLKSLMVVGIDSYHDASLGGRSVGGFVASTNRSLTRWYSRVCFQTPGQELIDGLKMCLTSALKKYHEVNHTLPEKIIVFRDGVGDGQLNTVANYEVPQISECFALFGETYQPQLAMIVVQKRINTRIFSFEARGGQHMLDNPGPGTVLDHTVTRKDWYDFFLVSQHVRQGTVTPTHYVVVHNSTSLKPDHVQRLSYKLTHLYYNWPGTVRVPAPCQYAHKIAYLVGTSLHKDPALHLSDRLFYL